MRTVSDLDSLVQTVLTDDTRHTKQHYSQRMDRDDSEPGPGDKNEWHRSSDAMQDEPEHLAPRPVFPGGIAGNNELREDQSMSLHDLSSHPRFSIAAMADFDFKSMTMGSGDVPVTYPPDNGRRMVMMYGQADTDGSSVQGGVFSPDQMTEDGGIYRPLIPQPPFSMQSTMPPGAIDPYSTEDGGFG